MLAQLVCAETRTSWLVLATKRSGVVAWFEPSRGSQRKRQVARPAFFVGSLVDLRSTIYDYHSSAHKNEISEVGRRPRKRIEYPFSTGGNGNKEF